MSNAEVNKEQTKTGFIRGLNLLDSTMLVVGSMIGGGIFIVSADIARQVGSPGWLMATWIITGILTVMAALSYGELAAMMPKAGGQYVYLREAFSPSCGFLYGWTLFMVIQTGTIAAVAISFARYLGVLVPVISEQNYLLPPSHITTNYAVSLSTAQLIALLMIVFLTWMNTRGLKVGKIIQNVFTISKTSALFLLIVLGLLIGWNQTAVSSNFSDLWTPRGTMQDVGSGLTAATMYGLFIGILVAQVNSLFAVEAWNNITFTAGEVKNPKRNIPLSLFLGTVIVIGLFVLVNVAYLVALPIEAIQTVPNDRVAAASADVTFPGYGGLVIAVAIMISTFGCNNGLILAGARAYYAMARDGLFFRSVGRLNENHVPAWGLLLQGIWATMLVLPRTYKGVSPATGQPLYSNLYGDLITYAVSAALVFYILTIAGVFRLRWLRPDAERPYRAWGYPVFPFMYILGATAILIALFIYQPATTWPGMIIVATGIPIYFIWRYLGAASPRANLPEELDARSGK